MIASAIVGVAVGAAPTIYHWDRVVLGVNIATVMAASVAVAFTLTVDAPRRETPGKLYLDRRKRLDRVVLHASENPRLNLMMVAGVGGLTLGIVAAAGYAGPSDLTGGEQALVLGVVFAFVSALLLAFNLFERVLPVACLACVELSVALTLMDYRAAAGVVASGSVVFLIGISGRLTG